MTNTVTVKPIRKYYVCGRKLNQLLTSFSVPIILFFILPICPMPHLHCRTTFLFTQLFVPNKMGSLFNRGTVNLSVCSNIFNLTFLAKEGLKPKLKNFETTSKTMKKIFKLNFCYKINDVQFLEKPLTGKIKALCFSRSFYVMHTVNCTSITLCIILTARLSKRFNKHVIRAR